MFSMPASDRPSAYNITTFDLEKIYAFVQELHELREMQEQQQRHKQEMLREQQELHKQRQAMQVHAGSVELERCVIEPTPAPKHSQVLGLVTERHPEVASENRSRAKPVPATARIAIGIRRN